MNRVGFHPPEARAARTRQAAQIRQAQRPVAFERAGLRGLALFLGVSVLLWIGIIYAVLWVFSW